MYTGLLYQLVIVGMRSQRALARIGTPRPRITTGAEMSPGRFLGYSKIPRPKRMARPCAHKRAVLRSDTLGQPSQLSGRAPVKNTSCNAQRPPFGGTHTRPRRRQFRRHSPPKDARLKKDANPKAAAEPHGGDMASFVAPPLRKASRANTAIRDSQRAQTSSFFVISSSSLVISSFIKKPSLLASASAKCV